MDSCVPTNVKTKNNVVIEQKTVQNEGMIRVAFKKFEKHADFFSSFFFQKNFPLPRRRKNVLPDEENYFNCHRKICKGRSCESFFLISGKGSTFAMSRTLKRGNRARRRTVKARERSKGGKSRDFFFLAVKKEI